MLVSNMLKTMQWDHAYYNVGRKYWFTQEKKSSADILLLSQKTFYDHYSKVNFIPERSFHKILKTPAEY